MLPNGLQLLGRDDPAQNDTVAEIEVRAGRGGGAKGEEYADDAHSSGFARGAEKTRPFVDSSIASDFIILYSRWQSLLKDIRCMIFLAIPLCSHTQAAS